MWALKNSFHVSISTMYLNFDRRKTRLEAVLHTLLVCESQRSLLSMVILKDGVLTLDQFTSRLERDRAVRVTINWNFCLVAIVTDLVLIGLMTI